MAMIFKKPPGFTLIELMVSVALFSTIAAVFAGIFFSGFRAQERTLMFQTLFDETSFFIEYLGRSLRMARKSTTSGCLSSPGLNYELTRSGKGIKFITAECACQEIFWDQATNRLKEVKEGSEEFLTSSNLEVLGLKFNLLGETQEDNLQSRATVSLKLRGRGGRAEGQPEILIQTSVSQRRLDLQQGQ
jgi:prepilin-type N-terminal cleavage/methylation domain-containing protein